MELSVRLRKIADMVTKGNKVADIGTDHGYLSIYLIEQNIASDVIAMDVAKGPLARAVSNIAKAQLSEKIETRLSDGVSELKTGEADTVVIAGMGGHLIIKILQNGKEILKSVKEVIISPQSDIELVRRYLGESGYDIVEEEMLIEDEKKYVIIKFTHGTMKYTKRCEYKYGKELLLKKNKVLFDELVKEKQLYEKIKKELSGKESDSVSTRLNELETELECILEAIEYYDM